MVTLYKEKQQKTKTKTKIKNKRRVTLVYCAIIQSFFCFVVNKPPFIFKNKKVKLNPDYLD